LGPVAVNPLGLASFNGQVTFTTSALGTGSHTLTVVYSGDTNFVGSISDVVTQVVNQAGTQTALTSSVNPSLFGQEVTFTATVTAVAPGAGIPTGEVDFFDGDTIVGIGFLDGNGQATLTTADLEVGVHAITVTYAGDSNFSGNTSARLLQSVISGPGAPGFLRVYLPVSPWNKL